MKTGPKYKISRRLGESVFSKTDGPKFAMALERKKAKKGIGAKRRGARSEYGVQLIEKQKVRYTYGIHERQFATYVKKARADKKVSPNITLYKLLESRLDNVVFRLGLVLTRPFARQVVTHGHILVNGRKVNIPSYKVQKGDIISVRKESKDSKIFTSLDDKEISKSPNWLVLDFGKLEGKVIGDPGGDEAPLNLNFSSVIEFYSRV